MDLHKKQAAYKKGKKMFFSQLPSSFTFLSFPPCFSSFSLSYVKMQNYFASLYIAIGIMYVHTLYQTENYNNVAMATVKNAVKSFKALYN